MADARRVQRVSKQIQRYVATIIDEELSLPAMVSVIDVRCDSSFTKAHVSVSTYGEPEAESEVMAELEDNAWFIRKELSRRTKMKRTPELIFVSDTSPRDGQAMIDLIDGQSSTRRTDLT